MIVTKEQTESLLESSKPLMKWLNENCDQHCDAHVDLSTVTLTEGIARLGTEEFIKD
jgi:hypothetical protein